MQGRVMRKRHRARHSGPVWASAVRCGNENAGAATGAAPAQGAGNAARRRSPDGASVQPQQIAEANRFHQGRDLSTASAAARRRGALRPALGGEGVGAEFGLLGQLPGPGGRLRSPAGQPLKIEIGRDGRRLGFSSWKRRSRRRRAQRRRRGRASASRRAARRAGSRRRGSFGPSFGRAADSVGVGVGAAESGRGWPGAWAWERGWPRAPPRRSGRECSRRRRG